MKSEDQDSYYEEDWWVELVEGELEPNLREDLALLLANSSPDRMIVESLKKTRKLVKESDDVCLPEDGHFYDRLQAKIMASLDDGEAQPSLPVNRRSRVAWSSILGTVGLTMMMCLVSWMTLRPEIHEKRGDQVGLAEVESDRFVRTIAMLDIREQTALARSISGHESEMDFLQSVVDERLKNLDPVQAEAMLRRLER